MRLNSTDLSVGWQAFDKTHLKCSRNGADSGGQRNSRGLIILVGLRGLVHVLVTVLV